MEKTVTKTTTKNVEVDFGGVAKETLDELEQVIKTTEKEIDTVVAPVRKSVLKRFPLVFLMAVTFGFTATVTGFEQILVQNEILQNNPWLIVSIGVVTLLITGTVYKKLG